MRKQFSVVVLLACLLLGAGCATGWWANDPPMDKPPANLGSPRLYAPPYRTFDYNEFLRGRGVPYDWYATNTPMTIPPSNEEILL